MSGKRHRPAPPLIVETGPEAATTIIFIHGLGAGGETFRPVAEALGRGLAAPVRFVLPTAPVRPVAFCGGRAVTAWFDLPAGDFLATEDTSGLRAAAAYFSRLIEAEIARGVEPARIVLGGFSQGGAISLMTGLRQERRLGAIIALSGWLPLASSLGRDRSAEGGATPIFLGHGTRDPVTPLWMAQTARDQLSARGNPVDLRAYPIGHSVDAAELGDLVAWLNNKLF